MTRTYKILATVGAAFTLWLPFTVFAQTQTNFVFVQQGVVSSTVDLSSFSPAAQLTQDIFVGNGLTGTTTEAFVTFNASFNTTAQTYYPVFIEVREYSDSSYTSFVGLCQFAPVETSSYGTTSPFTQLDQHFCSGWNYVFDPTMYYDVQISWSFNPAQLTSSFLVSGSGSNTHSLLNNGAASSTVSSFESQFALTGDGFLIVPTASSTGLYLSGANSFCNSEFGTSTGIINGIETDFANALCQVVGYAFVPTPLSVQQFQQLQPFYSSKIPFSYVFGTIGTWNALTASSSTNLPTYTIDLSSVNFASSTALGNLLPSNLDLLSSSTVNKYLPAGAHDALYSLAEVAIWLTVVGYMFYEVRHILKS